LDFVDVALKALRGSGILHVYMFKEEPKAVERAEEVVRLKVEELGWRVVRVSYSGTVRQVAPRRWQVVIDCEVSRH
jgi:tRNA G37 N-methylase Trm5